MEKDVHKGLYIQLFVFCCYDVTKKFNLLHYSTEEKLFCPYDCSLTSCTQPDHITLITEENFTIMCRNIGGIKMEQGVFQRGCISARLQYMLVSFDH